MSVKSTRYISRKDAEEKYVDLYMQIKRDKIIAKAKAMNDTDLEDKLERLNDKAHDGEGFENYLIRN